MSGNSREDLASRLPMELNRTAFEPLHGRSRPAFVRGAVAGPECLSPPLLTALPPSPSSRTDGRASRLRRRSQATLRSGRQGSSRIKARGRTWPAPTDGQLRVQRAGRFPGWVRRSPRPRRAALAGDGYLRRSSQLVERRPFAANSLARPSFIVS